MKLWMVAAIALVTSVAGAAIAVGVMAVWEPWEQTDSDEGGTEITRRLTGAEAAALVQADRGSIIVEEAEERVGRASTACEAVDFNTSLGAWIVVCDVTLAATSFSFSGSPRTYRLFDETGVIERVE